MDKYNLGSVACLAQTTLFEGNVSTQQQITLTDDYTNYKFLIVEYTVATAGVARYETGVITPLQLAKTDSVNFATLCWGRSTNNDCLNFYKSSDTITLNISMLSSTLTAIYGVN